MHFSLPYFVLLILLYLSFSVLSPFRTIMYFCCSFTHLWSFSPLHFPFSISPLSFPNPWSLVQFILPSPLSFNTLSFYIPFLPLLSHFPLVFFPISLSPFPGFYFFLNFLTPCSSYPFSPSYSHLRFFHFLSPSLSYYPFLVPFPILFLFFLSQFPFIPILFHCLFLSFPPFPFLPFIPHIAGKVRTNYFQALWYHNYL